MNINAYSAKTLQRELVKGPYLEYVNIEENSKR